MKISKQRYNSQPWQAFQDIVETVKTGGKIEAPDAKVTEQPKDKFCTESSIYAHSHQMEHHLALDSGERPGDRAPQIKGMVITNTDDINQSPHFLEGNTTDGWHWDQYANEQSGYFSGQIAQFSEQAIDVYKLHKNGNEESLLFHEHYDRNDPEKSRIRTWNLLD